MTRLSLVRAVLHAYPQPDRVARGAEMEATILDAEPMSMRAFIRELADLARYGLRARAAAVASAGPARVLADGVCRGATWIMILDLSTLSVWRRRGGGDALNPWWAMILLTLALALALYGYDRLAGGAALAWHLAHIRVLAEISGVAHWLPPALLTLACFLVMVVYPRERRPDVRRLGWLVIPLWIIVILSGGMNMAAIALLLPVVAGVMGAAVATLPTDPRLAIAAALPVTYVGLGIAHRGTPAAAVFVAATPVVVGLALVRTRRVRARSAIEMSAPR